MLYSLHNSKCGDTWHNHLTIKAPTWLQQTMLLSSILFFFLFFIFFFFTENKDLPSRQFTQNFKSYFLWKNMKKKKSNAWPFNGKNKFIFAPKNILWILCQDCPTNRPLHWILSQDCPTKTITLNTQSGLPYQEHYSRYSVKIALPRPLQWILSQDCLTKTITLNTKSGLPNQDHYSGYSVRIALSRTLQWILCQDCPAKTITVDTQSGLPYQDHLSR